MVPPALPAQWSLVWHSTHIIVVTLQARRFPVAVAQSASDAQRSWQVLLKVPGMQRLGAMQCASVTQERHEPAATSQKSLPCELFAQCASVRHA
jgi:hypothetical protein